MNPYKKHYSLIIYYNIFLYILMEKKLILLTTAITRGNLHKKSIGLLGIMEYFKCTITRITLAEIEMQEKHLLTIHGMTMQ